MASARGAVIVGGATPDATDRLAEVLRAGFPVHTTYDGDAVLGSLDDSVDVVLVDTRLADLSLHSLYERRANSEPYFQIGLLTASAETPQWIDAVIDPSIGDEDLRQVADWLATRAAYRKRLDTFYDLASKHASLANEDGSTIDPTQLEVRLDRLRSEIDDAVADLDDESLFEIALDGFENEE